MNSVAEPVVLPDGATQLVRRWSPTGDPWAEMLIVHGLGEHSGRYDQTGGRFAEAGIAVHSFDLSGFGASSGRRGHVDSWSRYLDEVEGRLRPLRDSSRPVVLLGHSIGGLIALEYALAERPPPDVLVLTAPALGGGQAWQRALAPVLARLAPHLRVPSSIKGDQLSRDPAVGEAYFADPLVLRFATARFGAEFFAAADRSLANLGSLRAPTLVLHGASDTLVPPQLSLPLADLPAAERRLKAGIRHELFNEPEGSQIIDEVVAWLRSQLNTRRLSTKS